MFSAMVAAGPQLEAAGRCGHSGPELPTTTASPAGALPEALELGTAGPVGLELGCPSQLVTARGAFLLRD